ncbi:MAG: hypothetical protein ACOC5F_02780 [Candidatus Aminicenantaceae bacterium]
MKIRFIFVFILIVFLKSFALGGNFRIEGNVFYFFPEEKDFQDIYKSGIGVGGGIEFSFLNRIDFWIEGGYFSKEGQLTYTEEDTCLDLYSLLTGLKLNILRSDISPYLSAGGGYFFYKEENPIGIVKESDFALVAKVGCLFKVEENYFFEVEIEYNYCRVEPAGIKVNIGGLKGIFKLGYEF